MESKSGIQSKVGEKVVSCGRVTPGEAGISKFRVACLILENMRDQPENLRYQMSIDKKNRENYPPSMST